MYTKEKTVEKCVSSRTELNKCTQCVHGRRTQNNTVQCGGGGNNTVQFAEEEEEPVNRSMAYGLYVSTTYGRFHKSEFPGPQEGPNTDLSSAPRRAAYPG